MLNLIASSNQPVWLDWETQIIAWCCIQTNTTKLHNYMHSNNISTVLIAWKQTNITKYRGTKKQDPKIWTIDPLIIKFVKSLVTKSCWNHEILYKLRQTTLSENMAKWTAVVFITSWYCMSWLHVSWNMPAKSCSLKIRNDFYCLNIPTCIKQVHWLKKLKSDIHVLIISRLKWYY